MPRSEDYEMIRTADGRVVRRIFTGPVAPLVAGVDPEWLEQVLECPDYVDPVPDVTSLIQRIDGALEAAAYLNKIVRCAECDKPGFHTHWKPGGPVR